MLGKLYNKIILLQKKKKKHAGMCTVDSKLPLCVKYVHRAVHWNKALIEDQHIYMCISICISLNTLKIYIWYDTLYLKINKQRGKPILILQEKNGIFLLGLQSCLFRR